MPRDEAERDERTMDGAAESRVSPRLSVTERPPPVRLLRLLIKDLRPRTCSRKYSSSPRTRDWKTCSSIQCPDTTVSFLKSLPPFFGIFLSPAELICISDYVN